MEWIRIHVKGKSRGRVAIEVRSEKGDTQAEEASRAEPAWLHERGEDPGFACPEGSWLLT